MKKFAVCLTLVFALFAGLLIQSTGAHQGSVKAVLLTDASRDETLLWLNTTVADILPDRLILIESRDGSHVGSYEVLHTFDGNVLLKSPLREYYPAGSRIVQ